MPAHKSKRTPEEKLKARREASLRYAQKPEAKIKAKERHDRIKGTEGFKRMSKTQRLQRSFRMSLDDYETLVSDQNGACALCLIKLGPWGNRSGMSPVVDHNHITGKVRGVLHRKCNSAIGFLGDSADMARLAASYLER